MFLSISMHMTRLSVSLFEIYSNLWNAKQETGNREMKQLAMKNLQTIDFNSNFHLELINQLQLFDDEMEIKVFGSFNCGLSCRMP